MAAVASDLSMTSVCSFARANVDRVKPLLKQLGISRIPTVVLLAPDGQVGSCWAAGACLVYG
jgi:hypothetical protein